MFGASSEHVEALVALVRSYFDTGISVAVDRYGLDGTPTQNYSTLLYSPTFQGISYSALE